MQRANINVCSGPSSTKYRTSILQEHHSGGEAHHEYIPHSAVSHQKK